MKFQLSKKTMLSSAAAAGLVFSLGACSSESTEDANAAFCDSAANLSTQVDSLGSMVTGGTATVEQIQDQRQNVKDAAADVKSSAQDLDSAVQSEIDSANEAFDSSVSDIPSDQSLKQAAPAYASAVATYNSSIQSINSTVGC